MKFYFSNLSLSLVAQLLILSTLYVDGVSAKEIQTSIFTIQDYHLTQSISRFSNASTFGLHSEYKDIADPNGFTYDFSLQFFSDRGAMAFSLPEAYYKWNLESSNLRFGRVLLDWNPVEDFWGLAKLQNLQAYSLLDENAEGLMGLHWQQNTDNWSTAIYLSYLHIPQLNPGSTIKDQKFIANNEWAQVPPDTVIFSGNDIPIYYQLDEPSMDDVLFHGSAGASIQYQNNSYKFSAFAINKPENQLRYAATAQLAGGNTWLDIGVTPYINRHWLYGGHIEYLQADGLARLGVLVNQPDNGTAVDITYEGLTIETEFKNETYLFLDYLKQYKKWTWSIHYLYLTQDVNSSNDLVAEAPKWQDSWGLKTKYQLQSNWSLHADLKFDTKALSKTIEIYTHYVLNSFVLASLGAELIDAPKETAFWAAFRSNDAVWTKLSYNF